MARRLRVAVKWSVAVLVSAAVVIGVLAWRDGTRYVAPAMEPVGSPPPDLRAMDIEFGGIKGWFIPGRAKQPCALLMHGVGGNRRSVLARARLFHELGYSSLLFDFQAHGESPGDHITFGYRESDNAHAALGELRHRFGCRAVVAVGVSMGGAAALLGEHPIDADALVLESVYPTIDEAVADRMVIRFGAAGRWMAPLFTLQLQPRLGISPAALRPIDGIAAYRRPLLMMAGTADRHTRMEETQRLFAAASEPKELWAVPGATHQDLLSYAPEEYRRHLIAFLRRSVETSETARR